jgi:hypothetical protein
MYKFATVCSLLALTTVAAQQQPKMPATMPQPRMEVVAPSPVEKIDATTYRVGEMRLDTKKKTLTVPGTVNDVGILEFIANTPGGFKSYETALTLNTNAVSFNAALLVLGLDPARARPVAMQFDKQAPAGDPVAITVEWRDGRNNRKFDIEELLYDVRSKQTLKKGPWVYTGSTFFKGPDGIDRYQAEVDGVLIGFMHAPQLVIDNPRSDALDGFGYYVLNPEIGLKPGMPITLTVTALERNK